MKREEVRNYTQLLSGEPMDAAEFAATRAALGFGQSDIARALRTEVQRVQEWESGKRSIPGAAQVALVLFAERDCWVMQGVRDGIAARIAEEFPNGFVSASITE
jgi:DNA-binding transcriptional regulator YiaG